MSLEDEMLEQNALYQSAMQENETLKERVAALEEVLVEYHDFVAEILGLTGNITGALGMLHGMQKRTRALLHAGETDSVKGEQTL